MQTQNITLDRAEARYLYREYKKHLHYSQPIDWECMRAYQLIAQGRMVIKAIESVKLAGLHTTGANAGFPKLAICRADAVACQVELEDGGRAKMHPENYRVRYRRKTYEAIENSNVIRWPRGSFVRTHNVWRAVSLVPTPPLHLRPQRGLANYHILWEAEWTKSPPHDPYLLRRIGRADLWLVCAHWNLTEVERAALSTRVR